MIKINLLYLLILLSYALTACRQNNSERIFLGKSYAEQELKSALGKTSSNGLIEGYSTIIKDSLTAIGIAEQVLFSIYGKENITKQRPYEIYLIENYWVIGGTLPQDYLGGTFLIIIDARDCKIISIKHGK